MVFHGFHGPGFSTALGRFGGSAGHRLSSAGANSHDNVERIHPVAMDVLAGTDFFTVEVLTWPGLVTSYVPFFIQVGTHRVSPGGITRHPELVLDGASRAERNDGGNRLPERLSPFAG